MLPVESCRSHACGIYSIGEVHGHVDKGPRVPVCRCGSQRVFPQSLSCDHPPRARTAGMCSHAQLLTRLPGIQTQAPHLQKKHFTSWATSLASHRTPWPVPTEAEERGSMPPWKVQRLYFDSSPQGREAKRSTLI